MTEQKEYETWEKILESDDIEEIEQLLKTVITNPKIVDLIVTKFREAKDFVIEEELNQDKQININVTFNKKD